MDKDFRHSTLQSTVVRVLGRFSGRMPQAVGTSCPQTTGYRCDRLTVLTQMAAYREKGNTPCAGFPTLHRTTDSCFDDTNPVAWLPRASFPPDVKHRARPPESAGQSEN